MNLSPLAAAEKASFTAFVNGYLREVDSGVWYGSDIWLKTNQLERSLEGHFIIELNLPHSGLRVALEIVYRSLVGRHHFATVFVRSNEAVSLMWRQSDFLTISLQLIREIYKKQLAQIGVESLSPAVLEKVKKNELELLSRYVESAQLMTKYIEQRQGDDSLNRLRFIESEQALVFGHWLHPTPKSRQGIAFWEQDTYCPELKGGFCLHYFSVDRALVREGSVLNAQTSEIILSELQQVLPITLKTDHVLVPIHPLQAQWLLLKASVQALIKQGRIDYLGELGPIYTPTSSVRTVFRADSEWMYKLSIPVRITNSLRRNMRNELEAGMAVDQFLRKSGFLLSRPVFKSVDDPGFITVELPGEEDVESGFEVILRRNLFQQDAGEGICSVLSLVQEPIQTEDSVFTRSLLCQIIEGLAREEGRPTREVARDWFTAYWECAIESIILLYDQQGIALEAHQQNSLLDVSGGYPSAYYYRDNQGFYLSKTYSKSLMAIDDLLTMSDIYYDDATVFGAIAYYVFLNQLFAVIYRLGADNLIDEAELIQFVSQSLENLNTRLSSVGKGFVEYMLESPRLSFKTNLLARVHDIDELHEGMERSVYTTIPNPLYKSVDHATAADEKKVDCNVA
ncbi:MAG: IucA/IucC family protein [Pseudomonadales bacterium]|nr:IucA/IucC family protein [Pseudomonadales bacterium]